MNDASSLPIAIFDSGVGGLTVLSALQSLLPNESFLYFADTNSRPFGLKSQEELESIISKNIHHILKHPIKLLVIACHTACSSSFSSMTPIPIFKISQATLILLQQLCIKDPLLVLGTQRTISSQLYQQTLSSLYPESPLYFLAGSSLEKLIEAPCQDPEIIHNELTLILNPLDTSCIRHVLLACTHFPIYTHFIRQYFPSSTQLIDPSHHFALQILTYLTKHNLLQNSTCSSYTHYWISGSIDDFKKKFDLYFQKPSSFQDNCFKKFIF